MKVVIQRSLKSKVKVDGKTIGKIDKGFTLLVSFTLSDDDKVIDYMIKKIVNLRIFKKEVNFVSNVRNQSSSTQKARSIELN